MCAYANTVRGTEKTIGIKNLEKDDITSYVNDLRNNVGRKVTSVKVDKWTDVPTVQGMWSPDYEYPEFKILE